MSGEKGDEKVGLLDEESEKSDERIPAEEEDDEKGEKKKKKEKEKEKENEKEKKKKKTEVRRPKKVVGMDLIGEEEEENEKEKEVTIVISSGTKEEEGKERKKKNELKKEDIESDDDDDEEIDLHEEEEDILEKRRKVNIFGVMPFGSSLSVRKSKRKRKLLEFEEPISNLDLKEIEKKKKKSLSQKKKKINWVLLGNIFYVILLGWHMAILYYIIGTLCYCTVCCKKHGRLMFKLGQYYLWPFNKYIEKRANYQLVKPVSKEKEPLFGKKKQHHIERNAFKVCRVVTFAIFFSPWLVIHHAFCMLCAWMGVFTITIAKVHWMGLKVALLNPLRFNVQKFPPSGSSDIFLCVFRAFNLSYYKYSVYGVNIILLNLLPVILLTLLFGLCFGEHFAKEYAFIIFPCTLICTIPLSYYIGKAVSSISSQSSYVVAAFFNALFGSIIEVILYFLYMFRNLTGTVQKAITGSMIGTNLLCTGLYMFIGGIKYKQQYFNRESASVSAVLLFLGVAGVFFPSLFYRAYGEYHFTCGNCNQTDATGGFNCTYCTYFESEFTKDPVFTQKVQPLMWVCCLILPFAYLTGLLFAMYTHKDVYEKPAKTDDGKIHEAKAHSAPQWNKFQSFSILLISTLLYSGVAEVISVTMQPALDLIGIADEFAGVTLIGIIPNVAEYVNSVLFALENNIILSLEISLISSLQITLLQIPFVTIFSQIIFGWIVPGYESSVYMMIFPTTDLFYISFSVFILTYIMIDGKSTYFRGVVLLIIYVIIVVSYYFELNIEIRD